MAAVYTRQKQIEDSLQLIGKAAAIMHQCAPMRRCSAPSQQQASKRPRFCPPVLNQNARGGSGATSAVFNQPEPAKPPDVTSIDTERSAKDILRLISNVPAGSENVSAPGTAESTTRKDPLDLEVDLGTPATESQSSEIASYAQKQVDTNSENERTVPRPAFQTKYRKKHCEDVENNRQRNQAPGSDYGAAYRKPEMLIRGKIHRNNGSGDEEPQSSYYNVMWCKNSTRKHKKWEGDAILVSKGRSVKLMDMDGKVIGQGTGYKTAELAALEGGSTLVIGGKVIEVMNTMSENDYLSGQCFQASTSCPKSPEITKPKVVHKPFVRPQKTGHSQLLNQPERQEVKPGRPLFTPDSPGALVMPKPSQAHQWEHNTKHLPVVDVVVDPHISRLLRPHQREGVVFLYQCLMGMRNFSGLGAILADEMGLGKTLQCIATIWTLYKQGPYGGKSVINRILIVTPGSLVKNWAKEFKKWLGSERIQVFAVAPDKKVEEFVKMTTYPILIISYEMLVRSIDILKSINFDLVVCDEGHRLKNANIKTTSSISGLNIKRRVVLSGTPVQNDLQELYSLVNFCNPGILGTSSSFQNVYEKAITSGREKSATLMERSLGEKRAGELNRITSLFILRRTQEINQQYLPPKVEVVLFCQPSQLQTQIYKHLLQSRLFKSCFTHSVDSGQHLVCISALKKLCNHPVLIHSNALESQRAGLDAEDDEKQLYRGLAELYPPTFDPSMPAVFDSGKFSVVASLLRMMYNANPRQRVVLVSNYTQTLYLFEELCKREVYTFLRLDGQTPTAKRQQLVERFNSPYSQDFVFLLSSKAGGVGLNLIGASRLILYDIDWNPANDLQAMARVWRDGQRQKVFVYRLLTAGSVEEKIYQRQVSKTGLSGVVVDAKTDSKLHFTPTDLRDLFSLQENTLCATHDLLQCGCGGDPCWDMDKIEDPTDTLVSRSCQLQPTGTVRQKTSTKVCMSELMEWKHVSGPAPDLNSVDPMVSNQNLELVTYAFWNEIQAPLSN